MTVGPQRLITVTFVDGTTRSFGDLAGGEVHVLRR